MVVKPNSLCSNDEIRKWKWYVWITCWVVFKNDYYIGAITNKDSDLLRIWDKAEKKHLKWTSLPAIPDPGNSRRAHAFCRLAFVHWCYNLQVKEKQKLTFQTNDSLLVIEVYNFCYEVMDKVSEEIIYIKHEFDS